MKSMLPKQKAVIHKPKYYCKTINGHIWNNFESPIFAQNYSHNGTKLGIRDVFPNYNSTKDLVLEWTDENEIHEENFKIHKTVFYNNDMFKENLLKGLQPLLYQKNQNVKERVNYWRKNKLFYVLDIPNLHLLGNKMKKKILQAHSKLVKVCFQNYFKTNIEFECSQYNKNNYIKSVLNVYVDTLEKQVAFWKYVHKCINDFRYLNEHKIDQKCLFYLENKVLQVEKKYYFMWDFYQNEDVSLTLYNCTTLAGFLKQLITMTTSSDTLIPSRDDDAWGSDDVNIGKKHFYPKSKITSILNIKFPNIEEEDLEIVAPNQIKIGVNLGNFSKCVFQKHNETISDKYRGINPQDLFEISINASGSLVFGCECSKGKSIILGTINDDVEAMHRHNFVFSEEDIEQAIENTQYGLAQLLRRNYQHNVKMISKDQSFIYNPNTRVWEEDSRNLLGTRITQHTIEILTDYLENLSHELSFYDSAETRKMPQYTSLKAKYSAAKSVKKSMTDGKTTNVKQFLLTDLYDEEFIENLNNHPLKIASSNGMVNLVTGKLELIQPSDNLTKKSAYNYHECHCKLGTCLNDAVFDKNTKKWDYSNCQCSCQVELSEYDAIIREIFNDDVEQTNWYRWTLGYALCGEPKEKMMFVCHGPANNGKSLTSNILCKVMPIYVKIMDKSIVLNAMRKNAGSPSPEFLDLIGSRMTIINETTSSDRLSQDQCKMITGQDIGSFRLLHSNKMIQQEFKFVPFIYTNDKPGVEVTDVAMWNRINTIHFPMHFCKNPKLPDERKMDKNLKKKLEDPKMLEIIFNWLVRCSLFYMQNQDMVPPKCVQEDIKIYRNENNPVIDFMETGGHFKYDRQGLIEWKSFQALLKQFVEDNNISFRTTDKTVRKIVSGMDNCSIITKNNVGYIKGMSRIKKNGGMKRKVDEILYAEKNLDVIMDLDHKMSDTKSPSKKSKKPKKC